jgi:hypothetical protein
VDRQQKCIAQSLVGMEAANQGVSMEDPLLGCGLPSSQKRAKELSGDLIYKDTNPIHEGCTLRT